LADASVFLMINYSEEQFINVGTSEDNTISELAEMIKNIVGFEGEIVYDSSKPDGTPQKLLDVSRLSKAGWSAKTGMKEGLTKTYKWFVNSLQTARLGTP
jgi:GDP-L-fucose synthase